MSTLQKGQHGDFVETDCIFKAMGKQFESGGSYLLKRKDSGLREGILYHFYEEATQDNGKTKWMQHKVGTWDGKVKVHARILMIWRSNFGDQRIHLTFTWEGRKFWGINAGDNDIVRCKEYKNQ